MRRGRSNFVPPTLSGLRLPVRNIEFCFGQIYGIPTNHDREGAGLDNAFHVSIQER